MMSKMPMMLRDANDAVHASEASDADVDDYTRCNMKMIVLKDSLKIDFARL